MDLSEHSVKIRWMEFNHFPNGLAMLSQAVRIHLQITGSLCSEQQIAQASVREFTFLGG